MTRIRRLSAAAWPTRRLAEREAAPGVGAGRVAVAGDQPQPARRRSPRGRARPPRPGRTRRAGPTTSGVSSLMISRATVVQVALALHEAGDAGQVGLQPVLLLVGPGGLAQVGDHLVDVVLELGDLAAARRR